MTRKWQLLATLGLIACLVPGAAAHAATTPDPTLEKAYRANNLGVALLEQFQHAEAAEKFRQALALKPDLGVAQINLAIALLNVPDLDGAAAAAEKAMTLRPDLPHPLYVTGLVAKAQNRVEVATQAFLKVRDMDPRDVGANVNLGQISIQNRDYAQALDYFNAAITVEPYNVTATYNLAMALMRTGRQDEGRDLMSRFQSLRETGRGTALGQAYPEQGRYAEGITSTGAEEGLVAGGTPEARYTEASATWLGMQAASPARALIGASITTAQLGEAAVLAQGLGQAVTLFDSDQDGDLDLARIFDGVVSLLRNDGKRLVDDTARAGLAIDAAGFATAVVAGDYDNDDRPDLFVLRSTDSRLFHNEGDGRFADVTQAATLSLPGTLAISAAFVDVDHDGDLDLFVPGFVDLAAPSQDPAATLTFPDDLPGAAHALLRNNGDGTFTDVTQEARLAGSRRHAVAVVPTDFDNRRDVDLLVVNRTGPPALFKNMREGFFVDVAEQVGLPRSHGFSAVAAGDVNKDQFTDFYLAAPDGPGLLVMSDRRASFVVSAAPAAAGPAHAAQFLDYDNDGLLDLLTLTPEGLRVQRNVGHGWADVSATATAAIKSLSPAARGLASGDLDGDGVLDLVAAGEGARVWKAEGVASQSVRVDLSARVSNHDGVGAKVEILAGSLRQKIETSSASPAPSPAQVHIGLGGREQVDAVRVLWPAGIVQAETELNLAASGPHVVDLKELDRKPSSCPYLYAWNGSAFEFITDFMGAGEMGYWHGPGQYSMPDPTEYVRVRGDQLRQTAGRYEIRVTNELEEVLYVDRLELLVLTHPEGTEIYPNEGMVSEPRAFKIHLARDLRLPAAAHDGRGNDVLDRLTDLDRRYVDGFGLHRIRGYAEPHELVIDLGPDPGPRPILILTGWTDYAFSSDNVAAHQSGLALTPPSLEARRPGGEWQVILPEVGVPVGRPQAIALDLTDVLPEGAHEVRMVTNMRIYWDQARVGQAMDSSAVDVARLPVATADLRWRGFSAEVTPDGKEPFGYDFATVSALSPWKTAPGRYTREGDVVPLLAQTDDMFVVSQPGDAVAVSFDASAVAALKQGNARTYLVFSDGFSKEMDINSASPDAVMPLPFHGMSSYPYPETEAYPRTEAHRDYQRTYNTRLVARPVLPIELVAHLAEQESAPE